MSRTTRMASSGRWRPGRWRPDGGAIPHAGLDKVYPAVIALMVTWAFGIAGSAFFPVLFFAVWWRRTTRKGAMAGMIVGGGARC